VRWVGGEGRWYVRGEREGLGVIRGERIGGLGFGVGVPFLLGGVLPRLCTPHTREQVAMNEMDHRTHMRALRMRHDERAGHIVWREEVCMWDHMYRGRGGAA
jgi:hypothetical protein